jgi:hypothetical protein
MSSPHQSNGNTDASVKSAWSRQAYWTVLAAFITYFCVYGFRKPLMAVDEKDGTWLGLGEKPPLIMAQTLGYALSKFIGISVVSSMPAGRRAMVLLLLIGLAELPLVFLGMVPHPWTRICLFCNGVPLGMAFGLVMSFLEGRRISEAMLAGLCASFIVADGAAKAVGKWLIDHGVAKDWMPAVAGLLYALPLIPAVFVLSRTPAPTQADVAARSERVPMTRSDRLAMLRSGGVGLVAIVFMYLLTTLLRSVRGDFFIEIWGKLGQKSDSSIFIVPEMIIAFGVMLCNGCLVFVRCNLTAFRLSLCTCLAGFLLILTTLTLHKSGLSAFAFMTLTGLGLFLPYVAVHASLFERLIAVTRDRGNAVFLMYIADSIGYLGYVAVLSQKKPEMQIDMLALYIWLCELASLLSIVCVIISLLYYSGRRLRPQGGPEQSLQAATNS